MKTDYSYTNKDSYFDIAEHSQDDIKNYGFNYEGNLFKNSISKIYFSDNKKDAILTVFDALISYIINQVKMIKKFHNYAMKKNYNKLR